MVPEPIQARMHVHPVTSHWVDPRLFGSFVEHLGRVVYSGIYEPDHPSADVDGFRADVMELVRQLGISVIRYPGGNFVSGYRWEDGVGPVADRPRRLDLAWHALEPNLVGINEFSKWAGKVGSQVMAVVNLGTRGVDAARNLVEYANHAGNTYWSELRKHHGVLEPHQIGLWGLGNEMDGPWQIGHKSATEYGTLAREAGRAMKAVDPTIELVVSGSSGPNMATFPEWDATVLDLAYDTADYLALHVYYGNPEQDTLNFLAKSMDLDRYIESAVATADFVQAKRRSKKRINLSLDEWNVWFHSHGEPSPTEWEVGKPRLEDIYTLEDALLVGSLLLSLLRHGDRVKIACLAQLVNAIAPIMTVSSGPAWRQTIYFPFEQVSHFGRGEVLFSETSSPTYASRQFDTVPYLDAVAVLDRQSGMLTLFAVNRCPDQAMALSLDLAGLTPLSSIEHWITTGDRADVSNSPVSEPIRPVKSAPIALNGNQASIRLPALSWNVLQIKIQS
ncbi:MAG: alpha-N-arabinofuranosidase [Firmicutes bacterium]|nr:alpha-N-arabinofuranosidase [Bacillota bacterium]MCL5065925.1 alpha-N-arabinofuranosidase [Bacillota bacterium]